MRHIVLLGDSIFDNGVYVPRQPAVIEQLQSQLADSSKATLFAQDGDVIAGVATQLEDLPQDATDLVVSVGGNDALGQAHLLDQANSMDDLPKLLADVLPRFEQDYSTMLDAVQNTGLHVLVCTIYDQCPFPDPLWRERVPLALTAFNDCICRQAEERNIPAIELRDICTEQEDYSTVSPIEPSNAGGAKIVQAILSHLPSE